MTCAPLCLESRIQKWDAVIHPGMRASEADGDTRWSAPVMWSAGVWFGLARGDAGD